MKGDEERDNAEDVSRMKEGEACLEVAFRLPSECGSGGILHKIYQIIPIYKPVIITKAKLQAMKIEIVITAK